MRPVAGTQLAEQPPGVRLDRVLRDEQLPADLGVALAVGHPAQHLQLALGQHHPPYRGPGADWLSPGSASGRPARAARRRRSRRAARGPWAASPGASADRLATGVAEWSLRPPGIASAASDPRPCPDPDCGPDRVPGAERPGTLVPRRSRWPPAASGCRRRAGMPAGRTGTLSSRTALATVLTRSSVAPDERRGRRPRRRRRLPAGSSAPKSTSTAPGRPGQYPPGEADGVRPGQRRVGEHHIGRALGQPSHRIRPRTARFAPALPGPSRAAHDDDRLGRERCPDAHEDATHCCFPSPLRRRPRQH